MSAVTCSGRGGDFDERGKEGESRERRENGTDNQIKDTVLQLIDCLTKQEMYVPSEREAEPRGIVLSLFYYRTQFGWMSERASSRRCVGGHNVFFGGWRGVYRDLFCLCIGECVAGGLEEVLQ